ncbi:hypothetical protein PANA5342_0928 [Pantoea ananatis LMG 5342]|nr:hypothetical protein PANA5342_0928 [Pantoea ananatis LMG 5342]
MNVYSYFVYFYAFSHRFASANPDDNLRFFGAKAANSLHYLGFPG